MKLRDLPSVDALAGELGDVPQPLAVAAARAALERAREEIRAGADPGDLVERARAELAGAEQPRLRRVLNATGVILHTNLGRAPLAAAALEQVAEVGRGYSTPRVRRRGRCARIAAGSLRRAAAPADRCRGGAGRQQQRGRCPFGARGAGGGSRRGRLARRAGRDRRRVPHPDVLARSGARLVEVGTTQPHARGRLRAGDRRRDRRDPARAPSRTSAWSASPSGRGCATWRALAERRGCRYRRLGSGALSDVTARAWRRADGRGRGLRRGRPRVRSRATSCSAGRRRASSWAAREPWNGCGAIRCSGRCGSTS